MLNDLHFYGVTGFSVSEIQKASACPVMTLGLFNVQLKDNDLEDLAGLKQLKLLILQENAEITDADFEYFERITTLKYLRLTKTSVTKEGVKEFEKKRPDVRVVLNYGIFP